MDKKRARAINGADSSSCFMLVLSAVRRGICGAVPYFAKIAKLSGMSPIIHKKRDPVVNPPNRKIKGTQPHGRVPSPWGIIEVLSY